MVTPTDTERSRGLELTFAIAFAVAAAGAGMLARRTGVAVFAALGGLSGWAAVVALANVMRGWRGGWARLAAFGVGAALVGAWLGWFYFAPHAVFTGATTATLQLAAVAGAVVAFGFYFLATYGGQVGRETPSALLSVLTPLARLVGAAQALLVAALLVRLYGDRTWFQALEIGFNVVTAALAVETTLHLVARVYQPARLRNADAVLGRSVVLPAVLGERGPIRSLGATLEKTFGVRLADTWLVQLTRILAAPLLLLAALGLWASTAVTRVPVDSRGVLVRAGEFAAKPLPPGLHWHAPWPWARIAIVATERVQEISLGFERDLAGPVLWAEKHFEGEQNLLVGQGEELLTINVPVHYRVKDAVAYLRRAGDARAALEALGYRELLGLTTSHSAFGLMTTERGEITERLRANLQAAVDRLGLGVEIVFVGLKDVHPPVPVAPSYQDVVSAEEQRAALVDLARTYAVQASIAAQVSAAGIRLQAETAARERKARAAGEAVRFTAPLAAYRANPEIFMTRRRLEALEAALAEIRQLVLVPREMRGRANFYLGLEGTGPLAPGLGR